MESLSSVMRARQRTVVFWPSYRNLGFEHLSVEQMTLESVDESEENEFERMRMKGCNDFFTSNYSSSDFEANNNQLNIIDSHYESECQQVHCTNQESDGVCEYPADVKSTCQFNDSNGNVIVTQKSTVSLSNTNEVSGHACDISTTCLKSSASHFPTEENCDIESSQAAFDLANLQDSLPRLVVTAPERLHDEITGAFTLYSGVDTAQASLWSARLNFASAALATHQIPEDAESLDTSCCSLDSVVTASSVESGPRTFYDPSVHRPIHLTANVVTPIYSGVDVFKKPTCHTTALATKDYGFEEVLTLHPLLMYFCNFPLIKL